MSAADPWNFQHFSCIRALSMCWSCFRKLNYCMGHKWVTINSKRNKISDHRRAKRRRSNNDDGNI